jgi:preprotein translocase subunit Sec63
MLKVKLIDYKKKQKIIFFKRKKIFTLVMKMYINYAMQDIKTSKFLYNCKYNPLKKEGAE